MTTTASKQSKLKKIMAIVGGAVAVLALAIGVFAYTTYQSGRIEGTWTSDQLEKEILKTIQSEITDMPEGLDIEMTDYIKTPEVEMIVKDNKATVTTAYTVDSDGLAEVIYTAVMDQFATLMSQEDTSGLSTEELATLTEEMKSYLPTQEDLKEELDTAMLVTATDTGLTYDAESGLINGTMFEGVVKPFDKTFEITSFNEKADLGLNKGDYLKFKKADNKVTFYGVDSEEIVFEAK